MSHWDQTEHHNRTHNDVCYTKHVWCNECRTEAKPNTTTEHTMMYVIQNTFDVMSVALRPNRTPQQNTQWCMLYKHVWCNECRTEAKTNTTTEHTMMYVIQNTFDVMSAALRPKRTPQQNTQWCMLYKTRLM